MLKFLQKIFKRNTIKITIIFANNDDVKFEKAFKAMQKTIAEVDKIYHNN